MIFYKYLNLTDIQSWIFFSCNSNVFPGRQRLQTYENIPKLILIAKIVRNINESFPSMEKQKYHKQSQSSINPIIRFSANEIKSYQCGDNCLIKITVIPQYKQIHQSENYAYQIQFNQESILLTERTIQEGQIRASGVEYYKIKMLDNDKNIMIILTSLSICNFDFYVQKDLFPTTKKYGWKSNQYFSDSLIIQVENKISPDMIGDYIIGVFGQEDCNFTIEYSIGLMFQQSILDYHPFEFKIKENQIIYLEYIYYLPIQISIISDSNNTVMFVLKK